MDIDIKLGPPADLPEQKEKLVRKVLWSLGLALCAIPVAVYSVLSDTPYVEFLEYTALAFFVGPGFFFVYYTEKLHAFKGLTPEQKKELEQFCLDFPDIAAYCGKVSASGRTPVLEEFEDCKSYVDKRGGTSG